MNYWPLLFVLLLGCAAVSREVECNTYISDDLEAGCYHNSGNWVSTDYPKNWQIDYTWDKIDNSECEFLRRK